MIDNPSNKKLILEVGLQQFSYLIFDTYKQQVEALQSYTITNATPVEEQLWRIFVDTPILLKNYNEILVLHQNNMVSFVPTTLLDTNNLGAYLQFNTSLFESDFFAHDTLPNKDITAVYIPYIHLNNFLLDQYESFDYKSSSSIIVETVLQMSGNNPDLQCFAHFTSTHFNLIIIKNNQLQFHNIFNYNTEIDILYYLLFTYEQLQINPTENTLTTINLNANYKTFLMHYLDKVIPFSVPNNKYNVSEATIAAHFTLINSCE